METGIVTHEELATALLKTWGHVWALDFAVGMSLCLHPDKKRLIKMWDDYLLERIDVWMGMPEYQNPAFREEVHGTLADLRELLGVAAEADGGET